MAYAFPRRCGPCTYCCIVLDVPELGKKSGEPCCHLGKHGCTIHLNPNRPAICGQFKCLWLLDQWGDGFDTRPDNTKVLPIVVGEWERIILHVPNKEAVQTPKIQKQMKKFWGRIELQIQIGDEVWSVEQ